MSNSYFNENLNSNIIDYYINLLNNAINTISQIINEFKKLNELFQEYFSKCKKFEFMKEIDICIKNLEKYDKSNIDYEDLLNSQKHKFKEFFDLTSSIYINNYIDKIKKLNDELRNILYSIANYEFMPPKINELKTSYFNFYTNSYSSFLQDSKKEEKEKENKLCSFCKLNISICLCNTCFQEFCDSCLKTIKTL